MVSGKCLSQCPKTRGEASHCLFCLMDTLQQSTDNYRLPARRVTVINTWTEWRRLLTFLQQCSINNWRCCGNPLTPHCWPHPPTGHFLSLDQSSLIKTNTGCSQLQAVQPECELLSTFVFSRHPPLLKTQTAQKNNFPSLCGGIGKWSWFWKLDRGHVKYGLFRRNPSRTLKPLLHTVTWMEKQKTANDEQK